jgi:uncharacterized protein
LKVAFADTGYWIALFDPRDGLHARAVSVSRSLPRGLLIVTSELVLVEVLDGFATRGAMLRRSAVQIVDRLVADPSITIVSQSSDEFHAAIRLYASHPDKGWSMTDCSSFSIMRERGIADGLAYDIHFVQAGFNAMLR